MSTLRIAFAGLAHSHPFTDATNLTAFREHGEDVDLVGVYEEDAAKRQEFSARFRCPDVSSLDGLVESAPDLVIATPRPHETQRFASALLRETTARLFFNKVVAATEEQLAGWIESIAAAPERVGTSSVLRFAPDVLALAALVSVERVRGVRVLAQHDIDMFLAPDRSWQDDPSAGGGTLVTVGTHAWEMIGTVFPGAVANDLSGRIVRDARSRSVSEEFAELSCMLDLPSGDRLPCSIVVAASPGPEIYGLDVFTATGVHRVNLTFPHPSRSLGFIELAEALLENTRRGVTTAPWDSALPAVRNTIRAAQTLRGR